MLFDVHLIQVIANDLAASQDDAGSFQRKTLAPTEQDARQKPGLASEEPIDRGR